MLTKSTANLDGNRDHFPQFIPRAWGWAGCSPKKAKLYLLYLERGSDQQAL